MTNPADDQRYVLVHMTGSGKQGTVGLDTVDLDASLDEQARILDVACREKGFFRLPLTVIPSDVCSDAWSAAAEFFDLPEHEKRQIEFPEPGAPYGYSPFGFETLAKSVETSGAGPTPPDPKESLSVGPDCAVTRPTGSLVAEAWIRSPSLWPERPARLQVSWTRYYRALSIVAERIHQAMAVALDLPPDYFADLIDRPITSMRALNYPALDDTGRNDAPSTQTLRAGAHTDYGTLTILRTDDVAGLEIVNRDGTWEAITPEPDSFIVNLGDTIAQWTNDRWRSTMHRVSAIDQRRRQSIAFFHMANWDAEIECLPTCLEPGERPRHEPVLAGPWLMQKYKSTVPGS